MPQYYDKFSRVHKLLQEYCCKATYEKVHKEYDESPRTDIFFYQPIDAKDNFNKTWEERIVGCLDVVVKTKMRGAEHETIRFDITYSDRIRKYSMYVSLPTSSRSTSLSKDVYKSQDDVLFEIQKWLITAGCKKDKPKMDKAEKKPSLEQISLF